MKGFFKEDGIDSNVSKGYVDNRIGTVNGQLAEKASIEYVNSQLADVAKQFNSTISNESAMLGNELVDGTGWNTTGWTGDFLTGFTHTTGNTSALSRDMGATGNNLYQIEFDTSAPLVSGELTVSIGNSDTFDLYLGSATHYSVGIKSVSDGPLVFTPVTGFNKTISNISVKQIIGEYNPTMTIKDSVGANSLEIRQGRANLLNLIMGINAGKFNTTGNANTAIGSNSFISNTSGFWNVVLGQDALTDNTVGSRNTAIGYRALTANICGQRNQAIGSYALYRNTSGNRNNAMGSDALFYNTVGSNNVAIGGAALYSNTSGDKNIAIGESANYNGTTASSCVAIGCYSQYNHTTGAANIAIGDNSLYFNSTGANNIAIGSYAGRSANGNNISQNVLVGTNAGNNLISSGNNNVMLGFSAGSSITTGHDNVFIGNNAGKNDDQKVDVINSIAIGRGAYTTANNTVQLGDGFITHVLTHGSFETQDIGEGFICKSPNGTRYKITVDNSGEISVNPA